MKPTRGGVSSGESENVMEKFRKDLINHVKYKMGWQLQGGVLNKDKYDFDATCKLVAALRLVQCFDIPNACEYTFIGTGFPIPIKVTEPWSLIEWENTRIEGANFIIRSSLFTDDFSKYASPVEALLDANNRFAIVFK